MIDEQDEQLEGEKRGETLQGMLETGLEATDGAEKSGASLKRKADC